MHALDDFMHDTFSLRSLWLRAWQDGWVHKMGTELLDEEGLGGLSSIPHKPIMEDGEKLRFASSLGKSYGTLFDLHASHVSPSYPSRSCHTCYFFPWPARNLIYPKER